MRPFQSCHFTGKLNDRHLHPQANTEIRDFVFTGIADSGNLAFDATHTKPTGDENRVHTFEFRSAFGLDLFRFNRFDGDLGAGADASMDQCLGQRLISIGMIDIFTDHGDGDMMFGLGLCLDDGFPLAQIGGGYIKP